MQQVSNPAMNIIIPMAGDGSRFSAAGYAYPKPLIRIAGRPMIVQLLSKIKFHPEDAVYIGIRKGVEEDYEVCKTIHARLPDLLFRTIILDGPTRGAADTLRLVIKEMNQEHMYRKTISLDCDTLYFCDVLAEMRNLPENCGAIYYFEDEGGKPLYSYIRFDRFTKRVEEIREKESVSSHANTGAYGFASAVLLQTYLEKVLAGSCPDTGEFYTSAVISEMIEEGFDFQAIQVVKSEFACVGTPRQLQCFLETDKCRKYAVGGDAIVFDLETVSQLRGRTRPTEKDVLGSLQTDFVDFLRKMIRDGLDVSLSFENGYSPIRTNEEDEGATHAEIKYATSSDRETAKRKKCLFPVDDNFRHLVGW